MVPSRSPSRMAATIFRAAQGRVDLGVRVEGPDGLIGQGEVMGRRFRGDPDAAGLGLADQADRPGGADMGDVHGRPGEFGEEEIPGDHDLFRDRGDAGKAEFGGDETLVHHPAGGEIPVLAVDDDRHVQRGGVFERPAHQGGVHDRFAVIGKADGAGILEIPEFGEGCALRLHADRRDGIDIGEAAFRGLSADEFGDGAAVVHGIRVGHAGDGGEAARDGGLASGGDRLLVFESRLPQVGVHVDQAGNDQFAAADR